MQLDAPTRLYTPSSKPRGLGMLGEAIGSSFSHMRERITQRRLATAPARSRNVLVINGHPDPRSQRFCAALCDAYAVGLAASVRPAKRIDVGNLALPLARPHRKGESAVEEVQEALEMIRWAGHLLIVFPLWSDQPPAPLLQLLHAAARSREAKPERHRLQTARMIVTMEMPAFAHRAGHRGEKESLIDVARLAIPGVRLESPTFIGCVHAISGEQRKRWLETMQMFGMAGA